MQASVVGAGVSGLTTAVALLEAGIETRVVARHTHESTVSVVAAAIWTMTAAEPQHSTRRWAVTSWHRFATLADLPNSGIGPLRQRELERTDPGPIWWETTPYVRRMQPDELPAGYAAGFEIDGFMIEPPIYLHWLSERLSALGGTIKETTVERLEAVDGDVIVNCSGLGAAALADDPSVLPIRGQVVAVANPGVRDAVADESDIDRIAYVYPRSQEIVLGGTRQADCHDPAPDPATTDRILTDCAALEPRVDGLDVVDVRVGFRPGRPAVRLGRDRLADGRPVVHNYGHGGSGFILSWGCAQEVVELATVDAAGVTVGR